MSKRAEYEAVQKMRKCMEKEKEKAEKKDKSLYLCSRCGSKLAISYLLYLADRNCPLCHKPFDVKRLEKEQDKQNPELRSYKEKVQELLVREWRLEEELENE